MAKTVYFPFFQMKYGVHLCEQLIQHVPASNLQNLQNGLMNEDHLQGVA
jgi:hypothetical protein